MTDIPSFLENFLAACDFEDPVEASLETKLKSLPKWDSLAMLAIIVMFDMEYGRSIDGSHLKAADTIGDLFNLLEG
ncbi:MAG: acyl carrier protein [Zoogloeaceae bacterium]|jgi:acyl carrier protein|nr:acyl carrier protein [Zoogloeaceae bacterium]